MLRHHVRAALLACCLAAALTGPAWAAKDIPPVVPAGTTLVLRPGANPHRLQANTTTVVSAGATLICRPGVIVEAGADAVLSAPISVADLEQLLGLPIEERRKRFAATGRPWAAVPVSIGAVVVAVAVLLIG